MAEPVERKAEDTDKVQRFESEGAVSSPGRWSRHATTDTQGPTRSSLISESPITESSLISAQKVSKPPEVKSSGWFVITCCCSAAREHRIEDEVDDVDCRPRTVVTDIDVLD
mmetsp:Transcript_57470/g.153167  ORF Transcript_57470/g.153167 Transcript_57470/m.153167 type:complete len:112 (-) Transcript_57470:123-458(-)